ncbi:MAG TPA: phosphoethanolamine transferase [Puia sp.]|nr:phosphoethanolamine transferase [Puia sp.]
MERFLFFIKKNWAYIIPFLLTISLIPFSEFIYNFINKRYLTAPFSFMVGLCIFLLPVYFFRNKLKLYLILLLPLLLIVPFNLAYVLIFNSTITEATILMVVNTSRNEAGELLSGYLNVLIIFIITYLVALFLLFRKSPNAISSTKAKLISLFSLAFLALSPFVLYDHKTNYYGNLRNKIDNIFPFTLFNSIETIYEQNQFIKATEKERDKFVFSSKQDSSITDKQVHILIIGESCRYDHWGINGYQRNTSPLLSKRKNFISFSNVASSCYMTELAVPLLLTGVGAEHFDLHNTRKSMIGAFEESGFSSHWITNQSDIGANIKIHSLEANNMHYLLSDFRSTKHVHRDMELIGILKKILAEPDQKKFIVIHTLGSHYNYSTRYPDKFDVFTPSNKTVPTKVTDKSSKNILVNSYDNSILYTDAVIDSIITTVTNLNNFASVTFLSDHGEDLLDDSRDFTDHGHASPPSKYVAHIPFFIWYSNKLANAYPEKVSNLLQHKDSLISSENLINTMTGLVGIHYPTQDSLKDISGKYFQNNKQLILGESNKIYPFSILK